MSAASISATSLVDRNSAASVKSSDSRMSWQSWLPSLPVEPTTATDVVTPQA
jgi:hypothetical protein